MEHRTNTKKDIPYPNWCVTWHVKKDTTYGPIYEDKLNAIDCRYIIYGREKGESGETPHYQIFLQLHSKQRMSYVKKLMDKTVHCVPIDGTPEEASHYCKKEGDYVERGTLRSLTIHNQKQKHDHEDILHKARTGKRKEVPAEPYMRLYNTLVQIEAEDYNPKPIMPKFNELRPWQAELVQILKSEPDDRKIHFYVDFQGGKGKSKMCDYLCNVFDRTQCFEMLDTKDVPNDIKTDTRIFLFDIPRCSTKVQWHVMESLKNGRIMKRKYHSRMIYLPAIPHCIVFTNNENFLGNDEHGTRIFSEDRIVIHYI